jgi:hypothetical protein
LAVGSGCICQNYRFQPVEVHYFPDLNPTMKEQPGQAAGQMVSWQQQLQHTAKSTADLAPLVGSALFTLGLCSCALSQERSTVAVTVVSARLGLFLSLCCFMPAAVRDSHSLFLTLCCVAPIRSCVGLSFIVPDQVLRCACMQLSETTLHCSNNSWPCPAVCPQLREALVHCSWPCAALRLHASVQDFC